MIRVRTPSVVPVLTFHLLKVLLRMCADLHNRTRPYHGGDRLPLFPMQLQTLQEDLVLFFGPPTHLLLTRAFLSDGRRRRRNHLERRGNPLGKRRLAE